MEHPISFREYVIVSCGTLVPELSHLRAQGFLDARKVEIMDIAVEGD